MTITRTIPDHLKPAIKRSEQILALCREANPGHGDWKYDWDRVTFEADGERHHEVTHYFNHSRTRGSLRIPDRIAQQIISGGVTALRRWTYNPESYFPEKP